jgi:hypothetical protein
MQQLQFATAPAHAYRATPRQSAPPLVPTHKCATRPPANVWRSKRARPCPAPLRPARLYATQTVYVYRVTRRQSAPTPVPIHKCATRPPASVWRSKHARLCPAPLRLARPYATRTAHVSPATICHWAMTAAPVLRAPSATRQPDNACLHRLRVPARPGPPRPFVRLPAHVSAATIQSPGMRCVTQSSRERSVRRQARAWGPPPPPSLRRLPHVTEDVFR